MKYHLLSSVLLIISTISSVSAIFHVYLALPRLDRVNIPQFLPHRNNLRFPFQQQPLNPGSADERKPEAEAVLPMPPPTNPDDDDNRGKEPIPTPGRGGGGVGPIVSDVLPRTRAINIFASLTRDFESVASRLNDASKNVTVLAPRNSAIQALPRKPWENPSEYEQFGETSAYQGQEGQDRARQNLQRFVEAHLVPVSPWRENEEVETVGGGKLKWKKEGDKIIVSFERN